MMNIQVLSLFPDMFDGVFNASIMKKAQDKGAVTFDVTDFRSFSNNKHNQVDDYPYGGGAGMVLKPEPLFNAVEALQAQGKKPRIILMCPQGERYSQKKAEELAEERRGQIGSGDRSERIRTYNYPQNRITDHRIGVTLYKLDQYLDGDLYEMIDAITMADQTERLQKLERV